MQSIQWYPIAFDYWELSQERSDVGQSEFSIVIAKRLSGHDYLA
jgi:hypothetical protein